MKVPLFYQWKSRNSSAWFSRGDNLFLTTPQNAECFLLRQIGPRVRATNDHYGSRSAEFGAVSIATFLTDRQQAHLEFALPDEKELFIAHSWEELNTIIRRKPVTIVVLNPAAYESSDLRP